MIEILTNFISPVTEDIMKTDIRVIIISKNLEEADRGITLKVGVTMMMDFTCLGDLTFQEVTDMGTVLAIMNTGILIDIMWGSQTDSTFWETKIGGSPSPQLFKS